MNFSLQFLGAGGAFAVPTDSTDLNSCLMQSNMVLTDYEAGKRMLIDCGSYIPLSAAAQGFTAADFDAVYISHEHADHTGGLEWLALSRFFGQIAQPELFCHTSVENKLRTMLMAGLEKTTRGLQTFNDYFQIGQQGASRFDWNKIRFHLTPAIHVPDQNNPMWSYGLVIKPCEGKSAWISSDTVFDVDRMSAYVSLFEPDIIFHDCETTSFKTGVHAHYEDLKTLPDKVRAKMWLYHYDDVSAAQLDAQADGFAGFVQRGQTFEL